MFVLQIFVRTPLERLQKLIARLPWQFDVLGENM